MHQITRGLEASQQGLGLVTRVLLHHVMAGDKDQCTHLNPVSKTYRE